MSSARRRRPNWASAFAVHWIVLKRSPRRAPVPSRTCSTGGRHEPCDTWLIPARTVHAIGAGVTAVEIQENSDITYRLYDYGRPRELHLDHGFTVADLKPYAVSNETVPIAPGRDRLTTCRYFTIERWRIRDALEFTPGAAGLYHLIVVLDGAWHARGTADRPRPRLVRSCSVRRIPVDASRRHRARRIYELE